VPFRTAVKEIVRKIMKYKCICAARRHAIGRYMLSSCVRLSDSPSVCLSICHKWEFYRNG